jgi:hypothetical protein
MVFCSWPRLCDNSINGLTIHSEGIKWQLSGVNPTFQ